MLRESNEREPAIRLITRADDCGSSHSANVGIAESLKAGFIKNVSLMAPCRFIEEAAEMLIGHEDVCFGLHATLNAEWDQVKWGPVLPISQVSTLVDENGMFTSSPQVFEAQKPDLDEIMLEIQAQLDKLRRLGFRIAYVDTHMFPEYHVPGMEDRMMEWADKEGLLYWNRFCSSLRRVEKTDHLIDDIVSRLKAADKGQYLVVGHPAIDTCEMRMLGNKHISGDELAAGRVLEARLFTDPRILQLCKEKGIVPIRYDEASVITERLPPLDEWFFL
ncbi:ChbG/HpnK family deacetylase [Paenibacillus tyrfis]|uniref:ChbG/HpnK family deacetylase n=1 Tax=Paenibacillus tyrfis TaxID=1501230 RepID=UPI00248F7BE8|nr:ChbG/HpnK family deacetylase [Paenibacillus tyrfis]